jgi:hypothetical protein
MIASAHASHDGRKTPTWTSHSSLVSPKPCVPAMPPLRGHDVVDSVQRRKHALNAFAITFEWDESKQMTTRLTVSAWASVRCRRRPRGARR